MTIVLFLLSDDSATYLALTLTISILARITWQYHHSISISFCILFYPFAFIILLLYTDACHSELLIPRWIFTHSIALFPQLL